MSQANAAEATGLSQVLPTALAVAPEAALPAVAGPVIQPLPTQAQSQNLAVPAVSAPIADLSSPVSPVVGQAATLSELVEANSGKDLSSEDQECIAAAVYFESRGEPVEGQLAVAQVVMNRAASGKYPTSACGVVKQPAQFSFVRKGRIPPIQKTTEAWRKAVAVTQVAVGRLAKQIESSVLWYHANYVSPGWGRRLTRVAQIGAHIFYD